MPSRQPAKVSTSLTNDEGLRIIFDAVVSYERSKSYDVTSDPIEDGSSTATHKIKQPENFSLTGEITRTPTDDPDPSPTRLEDIQEDLFKMADSNSLITIVNGLQFLQDYTVTNLTTTMSAEGGQAMQVSMSFQHLVITSPKTARLPPTKVAADKRDSATATGDAGTQSPVESEGEAVKEEVSTSLAAAGFDFLRGAN